MAAGWSQEATRALLSVWKEQGIQSQLDGVKRNRAIYESISKSLNDMGHNYTWTQCRTKVKNLTQNYRKVKDKNRVTGTSRQTCHFFEELDCILGTRPASSPVTVVDSNEENPITVSEADLQDPATPNSFDSSSNLSSDQSLSKVSIDEERKDTPVDIGMKKNLSTLSLQTSKSYKRKSKDTSSDIMNKLSKLEEEAEKREEARELRRLEFEAKLEDKRREMEMKREERMMQMFLSILSNPQSPNYPRLNHYASSPTSSSYNNSHWFNNEN